MHRRSFEVVWRLLFQWTVRRGPLNGRVWRWRYWEAEPALSGETRRNFLSLQKSIGRGEVGRLSHISVLPIPAPVHSVRGPQITRAGCGWLSERGGHCEYGTLGPAHRPISRAHLGLRLRVPEGGNGQPAVRLPEGVDLGTFKECVCTRSVY